MLSYFRSVVYVRVIRNQFNQYANLFRAFNLPRVVTFCPYN
jgi:hypothetical protein